MKSSASIRCSGGGLRRPPLNRNTMRARLRFHRQRLVNIGDGGDSTACSSTSRTVFELRNRGTSASGKLWCGPSERTTASSLAAACSSKSNDTQNRLRSARPSARLIRPPSGEWTTRCIPSASSKNRSKTRSVPVGTTPRTALPAAM